MGQQTYQNHARYYPLFHFVTIPILLLSLIWQIVRLYQEPNWDRAVFVLLSVGLITLAFSARLQALKAQDRVIRLEERLRYRELLSSNLSQKASRLSTPQIIALRFASDAELPDLTERVVNGELKTAKDIKLAVKNWRSDHLRV